MARHRHLLSARSVTALLSAGRPRRHGDGGCLYLSAGANAAFFIFAALKLFHLGQELFEI